MAVLRKGLLLPCISLHLLPELCSERLQMQYSQSHSQRIPPMRACPRHARPVACRGLLIWRKWRMPMFFEVGGRVPRLFGCFGCISNSHTHALQLCSAAAPMLPLPLPRAAMLTSRAPGLPTPLQWPRPELWFMWCVLPILAAQGASEWDPHVCSSWPVASARPAPAECRGDSL